MITYHYACEDCGEDVEVRHSIKAEPRIVCPGCGRHMQRCFMGTTVILVKGGQVSGEVDRVRREKDRHDEAFAHQVLGVFGQWRSTRKEELASREHARAVEDRTPIKKVEEAGGSKGSPTDAESTRPASHCDAPPPGGLKPA